MSDVQPSTFDSMKAKAIIDHAMKVAEHIRSLEVGISEMSKVSGDQPGDLAEVFVLAKNVQEVVSEAGKSLTKLKDYISYTQLPDLFFVKNIKTITTNTGFRVGISTRLSATIQEGQRDSAYNWLRANGFEALIQETVNASSLSSAMKRMIEEENREPPEELFSVKPAPYASVTKVKG